MGKVLLINGSPHKNGCTYTALREVEKVLNSRGVDTELLYLGSAPVAGCLDCGGCADGVCVIKDKVNEIVARLDEFDGMVVGSPVYYAGPSGQISSFMDRLFHSSGGRMAGKVAAAVVSCRRGGSSSAFDGLNKYFTKCNMVVASSQYWNQVHGNTPEEVLQDAEGLQTMRTLGENIAWLIKCIKAADLAGVPRPKYEKPVATNFIR